MNGATRIRNKIKEGKLVKGFFLEMADAQSNSWWVVFGQDVRALSEGLRANLQAVGDI